MITNKDILDKKGLILYIAYKNFCKDIVKRNEEDILSLGYYTILKCKRLYIKNEFVKYNSYICKSLYNNIRQYVQKELSIYYNNIDYKNMLDHKYNMIYDNSSTKEDYVSLLVNKYVTKLSKRYQEIYLYYLGLDVNYVRTYQCVGEKYGVTRERIRQIVKKCEETLSQVERGIPSPKNSAPTPSP